MPKPTNKILLEHRKFSRRQQAYERRYMKLFYSYLLAVGRDAAKEYEQTGVATNYLNEERLNKIYAKLYKEISLSEAKIEYDNQIKPLIDSEGQKDFIQDLVNILGSGMNEGALINLWRGLLDQFITVRVAQRITQVNQTTAKRISVLIERGLGEGLGATEVARMIRNDQKFNRNRSLAIARTETITAGNQGKYLAAASSPFEMNKSWIPTIDDRTRISHRGMVDFPWIDLNAMFNVANADGFLEQGEYPCDDSFGASNTVNCRCSITFKAKEDSNGRLIRK